METRRRRTTRGASNSCAIGMGSMREAHARVVSSQALVVHNACAGPAYALVCGTVGTERGARNRREAHRAGHAISMSMQQHLDRRGRQWARATRADTTHELTPAPI